MGGVAIWLHGEERSRENAKQWGLSVSDTCSRLQPAGRSDRTYFCQLSLLLSSGSVHAINARDFKLFSDWPSENSPVASGHFAPNGNKYHRVRPATTEDVQSGRQSRLDPTARSWMVVTCRPDSCVGLDRVGGTRYDMTRALHTVARYTTGSPLYTLFSITQT